MQRIVLAYSGGLHTSVSIAWLREQYDADVIAVTLDLGQGRDLTDIRERALAIGAARAHVLDAREEFARDFCLPALQAGALYEHRYPLSTSLGRPLIAKHLVQIAQMEGASAIAHGCTGKGNDQVRLDVSARALHPGIAVIAPVRIWELSRTEEVAYARARNIPVPASIDLPYSIDTNLWGRSIACGQLEDPWLEPPEDVYRLTRTFEKCSNVPAYVEVEFERGVPTKINSVAMGLLELISLLHTIAGDHGVGRLDMVENRVIGIKSREVYEAPAGVVLHAARQALLMMVSTRELERTVSQLATTYADLVYNGFWFTPLRAALDAFTASVQDRMTGVIRLKLFKGHCTVVGRRSPYALYDHALSTYGADDQFDHDAAEGFIRIYGLPAETAARKAPAVVDRAAARKSS